MYTTSGAPTAPTAYRRRSRLEDHVGSLAHGSCCRSHDGGSNRMLAAAAATGPRCCLKLRAWWHSLRDCCGQQLYCLLAQTKGMEWVLGCCAAPENGNAPAVEPPSAAESVEELLAGAILGDGAAVLSREDVPDVPGAFVLRGALSVPETERLGRIVRLAHLQRERSDAGQQGAPPLPAAAPAADVHAAQVEVSARLAPPPPSCPRHFPCAAVVLTLPRRQSKTSWRPEMRLRAGTRSTTSRSTRLDLRWCRWRPD